MQKTIVLRGNRPTEQVIQVETKAPELYSDKTVYLTQAEYDALPVKDETTLYMIVEG